MKARWIRLGVMAQQQFDAVSASIALSQAATAVPILLWSEEAARYPFALIAPRRIAPGREKRWLAWGLAAAVAAYRQFGVPAYLDDELYLHGRNIAQSGVVAQGECVVITSSFLMRFPGRCAATPSTELEQAFRLRLEAQHGWTFDDSWPTLPERAALPGGLQAPA